MSLLTDLTVVEIAGSAAGAYCAKLFADQGATVLLIGDGDLTPAQRTYLHRHKTPVGVGAIDWEFVDVIIESAAPHPLKPLPLDAPQAVRVQLSPFGRGGPHDSWVSTDLVDQALSGHLLLTGDADGHPIGGPAHHAAVAAGLHGFIGAMAGLFAGLRLGRGQTVEVSHVQVMASLHQDALVRAALGAESLTRLASDSPQRRVSGRIWRCRDGWVTIAASSAPQIEALLAVTGLTQLLDVEHIKSPTDLDTSAETLAGPLSTWVAVRTAADVTSELQAARIPAAPVLTMTGLLVDPQLAARRFFELADHTATAPLVPGRWFSVHDRQRVGYQGWVPDDASGGPLAGLRVLDLTRSWAGPLCTRILSDLGAEVVQIEAPSAGPESNRNDERSASIDQAHDIKFGLGKKSIVVDLATSVGRETFEQLLPHFDVLVENFNAAAMAQMGFDEQTLHELHPDLVYVTMPGFGRTGPAADWIGVGSCLDSHAGLTRLIGYGDGLPLKAGVTWPDPLAGLHGCAATMSALWNCVMAGAGGMTVEVAQLEATVAAIGEHVVQAQAEGNPSPDGNRSPAHLAQGVYPCAGSDQWLALSIVDQAMRASVIALAQADGIDLTSIDWTNPDAVDLALSEWTLTLDVNQLADRMQAAGVAAGPARTAGQVVADEHLIDRGAFVTLQQPGIGEFKAPNTAIDLSESPALVRSPAPRLDEHGDELRTAIRRIDLPKLDASQDQA